MKIISRTVFLFFILHITVWSNSQIVNLIPKEHLDNDVNGVIDDWKESGTYAFQKEINVPNQIDVTESGYNIFPNEGACGDEINNLIQSLEPAPSKKNMYMLYFPAGEYLIDRTISLSGYIILRGVSYDFELPPQTKFNFNFGSDYAHPCIKITGERNGIENIYIVDNTPNTSIQVTSIPMNFINGTLYYGVIGATEMFTDVSGACSGSGTITNNQGIFICNAYLKPGTSYFVTTTFSNNIESITITHNALVNGDNKQTDNNDITSDNKVIVKNSSDSLKNKTPVEYYQHTIVINGNNNWIRGVESNHTRRFHVYINSGEHNTISGCYFHHAADYSDNDGRGYGVCLSGSAKFNRIEDNIFEHLRHSMVLQGDAERNVFGYNYSFDIYATGGNPFYPEADLLLHGRPGNAGSYKHGPKTNLLEGNYVERIRVDKQHIEKNGPFNTFFRCFAVKWFKISYVDPEFQKGQYAQNVVGSRMEPKGSTQNRIKKEGFRKYWVDYPDYTHIPDMYASYYYDSKPDFYFQSLPWPLKPWEFQPPATIRCNMGLTRPVYAGWDSYENLCGPPNYKLKNITWQNTNEEYRAMDYIEISSSQITQNTNLNLYAGNRVLLKPGFKVLEGNNNVIIKVGEVCVSKEIGSSLYSIVNDTTDFESLYKIDNDNSVKKSSDLLKIHSRKLENTDIVFQVFPNPNNGEFFIRTNCQLNKRNIHVYSLMGNELQFMMEQTGNTTKILLSENYSGILLVKIATDNILEFKKVLILK